MKQKGFAPLLIILLAVILGVVGYLGYKNYQSKNKIVSTPVVSLTPIDMSNWKTYSNEKYNFSFQYPQTWNLTDISDNTSTLRDGFEFFSLKSGESAVSLGQREQDEYDRTHKIHMFEIVIPTKKYESLQAYLKENGGGVTGISNNYAKIETVNFGDVSAQKYTSTIETNNDLWYYKVYLVYIPQTQKIFKISSSYTQLAKSEKWMNDQIISTFKFTN